MAASPGSGEPEAGDQVAPGSEEGGEAIGAGGETVEGLGRVVGGGFGGGEEGDDCFVSILIEVGPCPAVDRADGGDLVLGDPVSAEREQRRSVG